MPRLDEGNLAMVYNGGTCQPCVVTWKQLMKSFAISIYKYLYFRRLFVCNSRHLSLSSSENNGFHYKMEFLNKAFAIRRTSKLQIKCQVSQ